MLGNLNMAYYKPATTSPVLRMAIKVATQAQGIKNYRLGAVVHDGSTIISTGTNSYKTHPKALRYDIWPHLHAEMSAILFNQSNITDMDITVVRLKADNSLGLAFPCPACKKLIEDYKLRICYYSEG